MFVAYIHTVSDLRSFKNVKETEIITLLKGRRILACGNGGALRRVDRRILLGDYRLRGDNVAADHIRVCRRFDLNWTPIIYTYI
jgi:hypothetical protein